MTSPRSQSTLISLTLHSGAIALLLMASQQLTPSHLQKASATLTPLIAPYLPRPETTSTGLSAGGGGARQQLPATAGKLPKIAPRQFVPPTLEVLNLHPKLAGEMTIEGPPEAMLPASVGDPLSTLINGSAGQGGPLGIGNGPGTGIGNNHGAGGGDGGIGTVYRAGQGVTAPVLLRKVEPEFSEEARRAKYSGIVTLRADVDTAGRPRNIRVVHSLGMGLDEKAVDAVTRWYFRPGTKDGKPVAVSALIEVMFHLL